MKVVCVHYGDKYPVEYVNKLNSMVKRHSDCDLVCLSDTWVGKDEGIEVIMGEKGFEGWWNKIQLFNKDFLPGERFLYLDLDIVITEDISSILERKEPFVTIQDWINPTYNSSAMLMTGGENSHVYDIFTSNKEESMRVFKGGDQHFITNYIDAALFTEDDFSSFRLGGNEGSPQSKVVVFHGKPNPHEVKGTWVESEWV